MARISSNEAKVTIDGAILKGCQSVSMDFDLEILDMPILLNKRNQNFVIDKGIIGDSTTGSLSVKYYANSESYDPFGSATQTIDAFIITSNVDVVFPNGSYKITGASLVSCNLEVSIGGFLNYTLGYEFDRLESSGSATTAGQDADPTDYNPNNLPFVFYSDITPSGVFSGLCAQSISVTLNCPRKIIKKFGGGIVRQPDLPFKVEMEMSLNKNDYRELSSNQEVTADKIFSFSGGGLSYSWPQSRAIGVSEGLEIDGAATQNVKYEKILTDA